MIFFSLPGNDSLAQTLAWQLKAAYGQLTLRHFPDGESYVKVEENVAGQAVVIVCSLQQPDDKLLPLYFLTQTVKELGARSCSLLLPYLAYMRQDARFQPGEGVTCSYFGKLISSFADHLITVDPHLHRHSSLSEVYQIPSYVAHAADHISEWIKAQVSQAILIGPDSESEQWVSEVAKKAGVPYTVLQKVRHGDRDVEVSLPHIEGYEDHTPVLVDDIISTARTMIEAVKHLKELKLKTPTCIGVHAVFAGDAYEALLETGADVVTCNTIAHESNQIDLSAELVEGVRQLIKESGC